MRHKLFIAIVCILVLFLIPNFSFAGTTDTRYYESSCVWETYNDNPDLFSELIGLPMNITSMAKNRPFNYRIWFGKGIVVYGTPEQSNMENGIRTNYKENTLRPNNSGFYKKSGKKRGEYRYDGYTIEGNLAANGDFPYDIINTMALEERPWIYRYWDSDYVKSKFAGEPAMKGSIYNRQAIKNETFLDKKTREWINDGMTAFKIRNGVTDKSIETPAPSQKADGTWDFYNFINVQSAPSAKFNGEGRMFRLTSTRGLFYMAFTINKYEKDHTPVNVAVKILNENELKFEDFGSDNPADFETQKLNVKIEVTATLKDENYINDNIAKAVYYTRDDRNYWTITLDGAAAAKADIQSFDNKAKTVYSIPMSKGQIKALAGGSKTFSATARCNYFDSKFDEGNNLGAAKFVIRDIAPPAESAEEPPVIVGAECHIPNVGFDIVRFPARDNTDMSMVSDRKVYINSVQVNDDLFFSGSYIFGIGEDGLKKIDVYYTSTDGHKSFYTGWAYVYNTKPNAQFRVSGTYKQNRKLTVTDISKIGNTQIVLDNYPITDYSWSFRSVNGEISSLKMRDLGDLKKELMYKQPGSYEIELVVTNSLGRVSEPYVFDFEVFPDYQPAVEIDLNNSVVSRNEKVNAWNYNVVSTDNDTILSNIIQIWYDSNNDGIYDQLLKTYDGKNGFPEFTPTKLGRYKFVDKVVESFGEETLSEFITPADTISKTLEREILVDNLAPMTGLYVQIPIVRPQMDTYIMLDSNLNAEKVVYVKNNRIEFDNYLRSQNILSNVEIWDMHTYMYSQPASTSKHTGSSYPSASTYYASGGYTGTLNRTRVSNNSYQTDEGHYETRTESKTATAGGKSTSGHGQSTNYPPSSVSYRDGSGFSGTLSAYGYSYNSWACGHSATNIGPGGCKGGSYYWTRSYAGYSGTVSRQVQVWVPKMVTHNDYTGYYSGTINKDVRQPYTDPFRPISAKYILYITDGSVNELNDLKTVLSRTDAKLILIGPENIKQQIESAYFITNNKPIEKLVQAALDYAANGGAAEEYYVLAGVDELTLNISDYDEENDTLTDRKLQYVQDSGYFDNAAGMESFAVNTYSDKSGWVDTIINKINKPGKYTIYRRVKDIPSTNPAFESFARYSGTPFVHIYAHRKPLALATLDWDFDQTEKVYRTTWVDNSYDLDHQFNRADKGIVERKIMYRQTGGEWYYKIPDRLTPGAYELRYFVKDPEGAWSEPLILNFILNATPIMQFNASLRTLDGKFSLAGVPASEKLEAFDLWTRFPYNVHLEMALYNGASRVSPIKTVGFGASSGTKSNNDIRWNNITYQIPETLPDRVYDFRILAVGDVGQTATKIFSVNVSTPLNLEPSMPAEVVGGTAVQAGARTSKYAGTVSTTLFQGTAYERTYSLTGADSGTGKAWGGSLSIPGNIPDGNYKARFTAIAPNGSSQTRDVPFRLTNLSITNVSISGYWNHWRGQVDILGELLTNDPHRFLSLECVKIDISTLGNPERVTVRFSPELEAMSYTDPNGHTYSYKDDYFGYKVTFPVNSTFPATGNHVYWEYYLPLAPSSKDWNNNRLRQPYRMTVTAYKGQNTAQYVIDNIDITGNIYDLTYIQPKK